MNPFWPLLGEAVRAPLPYPWWPAQPPPVDQATLQRVVAGLERLAAQHRQVARSAAPAEAHPHPDGQATAPHDAPGPDPQRDRGLAPSTLQAS